MVTRFITLTRFAYLSDRTVGYLQVGSRRFCTVERPWLDNKVSVSCVPDGHYTLKRDQEGRYTGYWELQNVPGRSEIIIHNGNKPSEIRGCILLGLRHDEQFNVRDSKAAIMEFHHLTEAMDELSLAILPYATRFSGEAK